MNLTCNLIIRKKKKYNYVAFYFDYYRYARYIHGLTFKELIRVFIHKALSFDR